MMADALPPADLHADLPELVGRLADAADTGDWLDAFLLAAGAVQVAEDLLQGTACSTRRLVRHLAKTARPGLPALLVRSAGRGLDAATAVAAAVPPARRLTLWTRRAALLSDALADLVLGGRPPLPPQRLRYAAHRAARTLGPVPADGPLLRPPACFRSFDQHPQDVVALVRRFAERHPDRGRPLLVVGVRTSGSYLAPLTGAALRLAGHSRVAVGTTRPGLPLLPGRAGTVRRFRCAAGTVLLVDDPPATGASLAEVAACAGRAGFPADAVVPLFASFEADATVPEPLRGHRCVVLPAGDWYVRRRLIGPGLSGLLAEVLPAGVEPVGVTVGEPAQQGQRGHLAVPLTVRIAQPGGTTADLPLMAEWTGVGYLGRHALTLATALDGLVPHAYGFADGVLLRERLPGEEPAPPPSPAASLAPPASPAAAAPTAPPPAPVSTLSVSSVPSVSSGSSASPASSGARGAEVARYVAARQRRLSVPEDRSRRLAGQEPVWEIAARTLAPVFGRAHVVLRPALLHPITTSLLAAERPCVVDGAAPGRWAADAAGSRCKTDFAHGAFSNLNLAVYDAAYDLAGAVAPDGGGTGRGEDELLAEYRKLTGRRISEARWCLLRLVHARRADSPADARRAMARAVQRFLASAYLDDLAESPPPAGPWCVLDVDGVLETDVAGFPAASPQGMLALRALTAHGYRTVIATGRSLPEVRDRCTAYRLAGGVAEYGALCFRTASGAADVLLDPVRRARGDGGLRRRLTALPSVGVDPLFAWTVRASVREGRDRTGLPADAVATVLADESCGRLFTAVPGDAQTDFVPRGVDKAAGVQGLLGLLGAEGQVPLLAVGDGPADRGLLGWARYGAAPGNAAPELRALGVPVARGSYQAGLAEIIGRLLGHRPGACARCRPPAHPPDVRALLALLAVPEAGRRGTVPRLLRLAATEHALLRDGVPKEDP